MNYKFEDTQIKVSVSALIEDIQMLRSYMTDPYNNVNNLQCLLECLEDTLNMASVIPGTDIQPSPTSVIAMGVNSGVIMHSDGTDLECEGSIPVSKLYAYDCPEDCPNKDKCSPQNGIFVLKGGYVYSIDSNLFQDEDLIEFLERM